MNFKRFCKNLCYNTKTRGWQMFLSKLSISQNLVEFYGSRSRVFSGFVRLAVSIFIQSSLGVWTFCKVKGLEVLQ